MSDAARLRALDVLLDEALDADEAARSALLQRIQTQDATLAAELRRLLDAVASPTDLGAPARVAAVLFGDRPFAADDTGRDTAAFDAKRAFTTNDAMPGQRCGPWRLLSLQGRGGMGEVWLGERADGHFDKRVAIKRIRGDRHGLQEIFASERALLARVDHPAVVRLLDAGSDDDGQPWLVTEWIDGISLADWIATRNPSLRDRVKLLAVLTDAVAAAHHALVVHGDIKPGNVLVDANRQPHLLDFGVATLRDGAESLTGYTPHYAAPERKRGEPGSTATDIYSLGVLIWETLVARRPTPDPHSQQIAGPSTVALSANGISQKHLRGDLDAIVLRATDVNPRGRYGDARALADDLRLWLGHNPVHARRATPLYVSRRFIRRHWLATGAAALIGLTLAVATAFSLGQAQIAAEQRDAARYEVRSLASVRDMLMLLLADPRVAQATALDDAAQSIREELAEQPRQAAEVAIALADLHSHRTDYTRMAEVLQPLPDSEAFSTFPIATRVQALCDLALAELKTGDGTSGAVHLASGLDLLGSSSEALLAPRRADCLMVSSQFARQSNQPQRAMADMQQALELFERSVGGDDYRSIQARINLATQSFHTGSLTQAQPQYAQALAALQRSGRGRSVDAANVLNNLGSIAVVQGRYGEAETLLREALTLREQRAGGAAAAAATRMNLARVLMAGGELVDAENLLDEALNAQRASVGEHSPEYAIALAQRAEVALDRGSPDIARDLLQQATAALAASVGADHPLNARILLVHARIALAQNDVVETERLAADSEVALGKLGALGNLYQADALLLRGRAALWNGDNRRARDLFDEAIRHRAVQVAAGALPMRELGAWRTLTQDLHTDTAQSEFIAARSALATSLPSRHPLLVALDATAAHRRAAMP